MKSLLRQLKFAEQFIESIAKINDWDRHKRIVWQRSIQKIKNSLKNNGEYLVQEDLENSIFDSIHREIHDIVPVPTRILGTPKDRLYSLRFDRYKEMTELNSIFSKANIKFMNSDWLERIHFESTNSMVKLRKEFDHFGWDYDKMMEGVSVEYLSNSGFIHILIKFKLHFIEKNFDYWFNILESKGSLKGATEIQILKSLGEQYLEGLNKDVIIQPFPYLLFGPNQIQVSKQTSNKYILKVLEIINDQLRLRESEIIRIPDKFQDQRIRVGATQLDIRNYFYQLTTIKGEKTGKPIISKEAIDQLLGANFQEFEIFHFEDKFNLEISKGNLRYFIYKFYQDFDIIKPNNRLKEYTQFLIDNFVMYSDSDVVNLSKRMSRKPPNNYPFKLD